MSGVDLVQWLTAQLDADAEQARAAAEELGPDWYYDDGFVLARREDDMVATGSQDFLERERGVFIAEHDPARVLREVKAKRATLAECAAAEAALDQASRDRDTARYNAVRAEWQVLRRIIRRDAAAYSDRPGYRAEWALSE